MDPVVEKPGLTILTKCLLRSLLQPMLEADVHGKLVLLLFKGGAQDHAK